MKGRRLVPRSVTIQDGGLDTLFPLLTSIMQQRMQKRNRKTLGSKEEN